MKKVFLSALVVVLMISVLLVAVPISAKGYVHSIVITVDGMDYYLAGAPDGPGGATDIPGHYWVQAGPNQLVGKHFNTGPFGAHHELVKVSDGTLHPTKVVWLRHTARTSFNLDGGPHPELDHEVSPGVDHEFIPNGLIPYLP
jgi:selenium-binding protein 1